MFVRHDLGLSYSVEADQDPHTFRISDVAVGKIHNLVLFDRIGQQQIFCRVTAVEVKSASIEVHNVVASRYACHASSKTNTRF